MDITLTRTGEAAVLAARGRIDTMTSTAFEQGIMAALDDRPQRLVIDVSGVDYISSAGLRVLLSAMKTLMAHGGALILRGVQSEVLKILTLSGFTELMTIEHDAADG